VCILAVRPGLREHEEDCVAEVTATKRRLSGAASSALAAHEAAVAELRAAYAAIPPGSPVRLAKRTSNLFRFSDGASTAGLDVCIRAGPAG